MTDQTPMEARLERMWGNTERRRQAIIIAPIDRNTLPDGVFVDRRKTHPTSPRKRRHD